MTGRHAPDESKTIAALRAGDEAVFGELVDRYSPALLRLARVFVGTHAVAEEVVQETWVAVLAGVDRFEARSALKTWIFRILVNKAKARGAREARSVPFSSLALADDEHAVPEERFLPAGHRWAGHWASPPRSPADLPENRLLARETIEELGKALDALPPQQRAVVTLRDLDGCEPDEVCELLGVTDGNQRVLLHRGRSKLRAALEGYLEGETDA